MFNRKLTLPQNKILRTKSIFAVIDAVDVVDVVAVVAVVVVVDSRFVFRDKS